MSTKNIAVTNFLRSLKDFTSIEEDISNARRDARSYNWDQKTLDAIITGIYIWHTRPSMMESYIRDFTEE